MFLQSTEICLRGLAFLVAKDHGGLVQASEIAAKLGLSPTYLSKAFQPLARSGLLRSVKGRSGGWMLAVDATATTIADVIEVLEPGHDWRGCVVGHETCSDDNACPFHEVWTRTLSEFTEIMSKTSLSSLPDFLPPIVSMKRPLGG